MTLSKNLTYIGQDAFLGCSSLTNINIPDSVTSIGDWAFYGCSNLTNVTLGKKVASIGGSAFGDCTSLTSLNIPSSVTSIGDRAFSGCSNLNSLYFVGAPPSEENKYIFESAPSSLVVYYIEGVPGWEETSYSLQIVSFDPEWLWGRYETIEESGWIYADTLGWLGWMQIALKPWVWHTKSEYWFYIHETVAAANIGWIYVPYILEEATILELVSIQDTGWAYSFGLNKWLYLTNFGWVYLI